MSPQPLATSACFFNGTEELRPWASEGIAGSGFHQSLKNFLVYFSGISGFTEFKERFKSVFVAFFGWRRSRTERMMWQGLSWVLL